MHFFCIFLQIYLHMSKKSCNFALVLGMVPAATIKHKRVMSNVCEFRCQGEGIMYRVITVSCPTAPHGYYYYVYAGRKRATAQPFANIYDAARYCTNLCLDKIV